MSELRNGNEDGESYKSQKSVQTTTMIKKPPTKILDLNEHCRMELFMYLNLSSLFNLAVANALLRPTAALEYRRRFLGKKVHLIVDLLSIEPDECYDNIIKVNGFKMCLQYLRCFGSLICDLTICYMEHDTKRSKYIHQYVNEYCSGESLVSISFDYIHKTLFDQRCSISQNFHSNLDEQDFPSFSQRFPNLRGLKFHNLRMNIVICIKIPFQHLRDLHIDINNEDANIGSSRGFTYTEATQLLQQCQQMECLEICVHDSHAMTLDTLSNIIQNNANISKLAVRMGPKALAVHTTSLEVERFVLENPNLVKLDLRKCEFNTESILVVIRQLILLKKCCCKIKGTVPQLPDEWHHSYSWNDGVRTFTLK